MKRLRCAINHIVSLLKIHNQYNNMLILNGLIGEGGFGKVLTAKYDVTQQWHAVKEITKLELVKHKTGVTMIMGELHALKKVDHPLIVSLHFAFQDRENCYFVMDLKTGGDLRYYLRKKAIFEEKDVAFYVSCISAALNHIHSMNIIHRDVKPENIILDERGYPHLADFGVAHVQSFASGSSKPLMCNLASGTKQYLAPEVFTKDHVHGPEADYWSLGVVAYELLFGRRPFDKHCPVAMISYLEKAHQTHVRRAERAERERALSHSHTGDSLESLLAPGIGIGMGSRSPSPAASPDRGGLLQSLSQSASPSRAPSPALGLGHSHSHGSLARLQLHHPGTALSTSLSVSHTCNRAATGAGLDYTSAGNSLLPSLAAGAGFVNPNNNFSHHLYSSASVCPHRNTGAAEAVVAADQPGGKAAPLQGRTSRSSSAAPLPLPSASLAPIDGIGCSEGDGSYWDEDFGAAVAGLTVKFGDHWAVDVGELALHLQVPIPLQSSWLGEVSPACASLLSGLFELRPSLRLGGRNISALKGHAWLREKGVDDWQALESKTFAPFFRPGKRFIKDGFQPFEASEERRLDEQALLFPASELACDFQQQFRAFHFIAPFHRQHMLHLNGESASIVSCAAQQLRRTLLPLPPHPPHHPHHHHPPHPHPGHANGHGSGSGSGSPPRSRSSSISSACSSSTLAADAATGHGVSLPPVAGGSGVHTPPRPEKLSAGGYSPFRFIMGGARK